MKKSIKCFIAIAICAGVLSCKKTEVNPAPNQVEFLPSVPSGSLNLGNNVVASFFGEVKDQNGLPLSSAVVVIGNKTTSTDANGIFFIENAQVKEKLAKVEIQKDGYFSRCKSLIPSVGSINEVQVSILNKTLSNTVATGSSSSINLGDAVVNFDGEFVHEDGSHYSGNVNVYVVSLDPNLQSNADLIPASNFAENESGEAGVIDCFGMIGVKLEDTNGSQLQLQNGSPAEIQIPISPNLTGTAPATIPLWYLDEENGYWIQEGTATLVNDVYVGEVSHFSFWSVGYWSNYAILNAQVEDNLGNPFSGIVTLTTNNQSSTANFVNSNSAGVFLAFVPANSPIQVEIEDVCQNLILNQTVGGYSANSLNSELFTANLTNDYYHVSGNLVDCSSAPVSSGYVYIQSSGNFKAYYFTNGTFSVMYPDCGSPTTVDLLFTDLNTANQTTSLSEPVIGNSVNFGTETICATSTEYITYTVDGSVHNLALPYYCHEADSFGTGNSIHLDWYENGGNGWFWSLSGNTNALGAHNWAQDLNMNTGYQCFGSIENQSTANITQNLNFNVTAYPTSVGDYLDMTINGTYIDLNSINHTLTVDLHVMRDF